MSDSESSDSDKRIRYKLESVRNKSKDTDSSKTKSRDVRQSDKDSRRSRKRYSRSSSPKRSHKKDKRKKKKRSSSRSSSTSSDRSVKTKLVNNELKPDNFINSQKAKPLTLNEQKQISRNEIIGPALPPHLLQTIKSNQDCTTNYNIELGNIIKDNASLQRPICSSVGPKLPPHMTTSTKSEPIGPSLSVTLGEKKFVEQNQQTLQDTYTTSNLLNSDDSKSEHGLEARLQSQAFVSLASSDRIIGPSLPPHLRKTPTSLFIQNDKQEGAQSLTATIGPSIPPHLRKNPTSLFIQNDKQEGAQSLTATIGPSIPPHLQIKHPSESNLQTEADLHSLASTSVEGPHTDQKRIGPSLPAHLRKKLQEETDESLNNDVQTDEEEDVYGPLSTGILSNSLPHKALEERALQLKIDKLKPNRNNEPKSESWMIELPTVKAANSGLGPQQFRNRSGPDLSDERYKLESVQNKSKETDSLKTKSWDVRQSDKDSRRSGKRYSRSSSPKRSHKKNKRKKKKKNSSSSSSTSSDCSVETKLVNNELKQDYFINSQKAKPLTLNEQKQISRNEIIGPALPPHLLQTIKSNQDCTTDYNIERGNIIKDNASLQRPTCSLVGPKLPPQITTSTKSEPIGPSLSVTLGEKKFVGQNQQTLQDTYTTSNLLNSDDSKLEQGLEARLQSQAFLSLASSDRIIGPSLPPHLRKNPKSLFIQNDKQEEAQSLTATIGPSIPPRLQIKDPSKSNLQTEADFHSLASTSVEGPHTDQKRIGPSLPAHLRKKLQEETDESLNNDVQTDEEEDVYGPLPTGMLSNSLSHKALEERALQLKIDQLQPNRNKEPGRESWMIELPTAKAANFGLGPRQFRNKSGPDLSDRSSWTDLPGDKKKKKSEDVPVDLKKEAELNELIQRDKEQEMLTRKHKRKEKSLLKMHKEQLAKEKKEEKSSERRPFSRDIDLQVNRFDDAQKQAILKKAQLLDDRFSSGKGKYL